MEDFFMLLATNRFIKATIGYSIAINGRIDVCTLSTGTLGPISLYI